MEQQRNIQEGPQEGQEKRKGPIMRMYDWTLAIIGIVTVIGLAWKYIIKPLYLGE
jgi:hypothetical protein